MLIQTFGKTTVEFDFDLTKEYYKTHTVCDCCDDKNYQHLAKSKFPELDTFLSQFGADISRPDETGSVYLDKSETIQYLFVAYTVVGKIITDGQETITLTEYGPPVKISINNEHYPNEQKGDYFTIVVSGIEMPWLLDGEYPDKPKKSFFQRLITHFKK